MRPRSHLSLLLLTCCLAIPSDALLLPLLFPVSIKITLHSNHKPKPPPHHHSSFHFEAVPVYREVKGSVEINTPKFSYGHGHKYGTSYGDGHLKVYTEEPHIKGGYASGYVSTGPGGYIDGHISINSHSATPSTHYKGSPYDSDHYKGVSYAQPDPYDHGSSYGKAPPTHYKGTSYDEKHPPTHYKGTPYDEKHPATDYEEVSYHHDKGTPYEEEVPTHYKGTTYEEDARHYKGSGKPLTTYKPGSYIKPISGGYKISDYVSDDKTSTYPEEEEDARYVAVPPGKSYAEIAAAHKASYAPKAYAADQYSDLGVKKKQEYEHDASYIDDSLPVYKDNIPRPRYTKYQARYGKVSQPRPRVHPKARSGHVSKAARSGHVSKAASSSRHDRIVPQESSEHKVAYGGFGSSVYGDSYAKLSYVPKNLRISVRAY